MRLFATKREFFPDPRRALAEGIVQVSDDLRIERLFEAYSFGIFPWPHGEFPTLWFCPEERGVLDFSEFHIPRSLQKLAAKSPFRITFDQNFAGVIASCSRVPRPGQSGTWIQAPLARAYSEFHRAGYAHSVEVWQGADLVGGLYGVLVGGVFSGESMFYLRPNASKLALVRLVDFLRAQGLLWMDIQMVTPALARLGGKYISRDAFLERLVLSKKLARPIDFGAFAND